MGLIVFSAIAVAIVVSDQLLKAWVVASFAFDAPYDVLGDWLRIDLIHNAGGLFGMLQGSAYVLGIVSAAVVAILVAVELTTAWRSWLLTMILALLLGGAIGNFIDRIRLGYVVDFVDIGIGTWRFYVFNIADSAVTVSLGLILLVWVASPWLERRAATARGVVRATGGVPQTAATAAPESGASAAPEPGVSAAPGGAAGEDVRGRRPMDEPAPPGEAGEA